MIMIDRNNANHNCFENIVNNNLELFIIFGACVINITGKIRNVRVKSTTSNRSESMLTPPNPKSDS